MKKFESNNHNLGNRRVKHPLIELSKEELGDKILLIKHMIGKRDKFGIGLLKELLGNTKTKEEKIRIINAIWSRPDLRNVAYKEFLN